MVELLQGHYVDGSYLLQCLRLRKLQQNIRKIFAITIFPHHTRKRRELIRIDIPHAISDLFRAGDFKSLAFFNGFDE